MTALHLTDAPTAAEEAGIREALRAANAEATGLPRDRRPLVITLRDEAGEITGGLWGLTAWRWLYIENLVVPPALRGAGLGTRILAMAEEEARARGCIGARLDTYSFQAQPFYERHGYALTGEIADCPPGHTRYSMAKRLDGGGARAEPWPDAAAPRATITVTHSEAEPAIPVALHGLTTFNAPFTGEHGFVPVNLVVCRPGEATPAGGLIAFTLYRWLFVRLFYLPEDLRGGGGTRARLPRHLARHLQLPGAALLREARLPRLRHSGGFPAGPQPALPDEAPRRRPVPSRAYGGGLEWGHEDEHLLNPQPPPNPPPQAGEGFGAAGQDHRTRT